MRVDIDVTSRMLVTDNKNGFSQRSRKSGLLNDDDDALTYNSQSGIKMTFLGKKGTDAVSFSLKVNKCIQQMHRFTSIFVILKRVLNPF